MRILMGTLTRDLRHLDAYIAAEIKATHLQAQLIRLALGVVGAVLLSITTGGAGAFDWKAIASVAVGALVAGARAIWPNVRLDVVLGDLRASRPAPRAAMPGGGSGQ